MLDFVKRICIALALAVFIGMLFLGTTTTFAADHNLPNDLSESLIWPTVGEVTDTYGARNGKHYGIDLAAPKGTPVVAIASGSVSRSYYSDTYGQVVFVEHDNGLETVYAHLDQRDVAEGQVIMAGELLGTVGNTGRSSGNHLHFEVHTGNWNPEKSQSIDPVLVLSNEPEYMYAALSSDPSNVEDNIAVISRHVIKDEPVVSVEIVKPTDVVTESDVEKTAAIDILVEAGDTLWDIAINEQVTVDKLKEWNDLTDDIIVVGAVLTIYPGDSTYVVHSGDSLSSIARKHGITTESIMEQNKLSSDLIFPGDTLAINI